MYAMPVHPTSTLEYLAIGHRGASAGNRVRLWMDSSTLAGYSRSMPGPVQPKPVSKRPGRAQRTKFKQTAAFSVPSTAAEGDARSVIPTTREISRSTTSARIAAVSAIAAATIALFGTYWSGERAAVSAGETVNRQLLGETERSKAEFLRGQRQVLYSRVAAHELAAIIAADDQLSQIQTMDRPQLKRLVDDGIPPEARREELLKTRSP